VSTGRLRPSPAAPVRRGTLGTSEGGGLSRVIAMTLLTWTLVGCAAWWGRPSHTAGAPCSLQFCRLVGVPVQGFAAGSRSATLDYACLENMARNPTHTHHLRGFGMLLRSVVYIISLC
jgi:hypothetical protein